MESIKIINKNKYNTSIFIDGIELKNVVEVNVKKSVETKSTSLVTFTVITNDVEWINEKQEVKGSVVIPETAKGGTVKADGMFVCHSDREEMSFPSLQNISTEQIINNINKTLRKRSIGIGGAKQNGTN